MLTSSTVALSHLMQYHWSGTTSTEVMPMHLPWNQEEQLSQANMKLRSLVHPRPHKQVSSYKTLASGA